MPVIGGNAIEHGKAYAGMVADYQLINKVSGLVEDATIPFGYAAVRGTAANTVTLPTSTSVLADFVGVAMYELNRAYTDTETVGAPLGRDGSFITAGVVYVAPLVDVVPGDPVFFGVGADVAGRFTNVVGTGATLAVAITGAKFLDTAVASSGQLSRISLVIGG